MSSVMCSHLNILQITLAPATADAQDIAKVASCASPAALSLSRSLPSRMVHSLQRGESNLTARATVERAGSCCCQAELGRGYELLFNGATTPSAQRRTLPVDFQIFNVFPVTCVDNVLSCAFPKLNIRYVIRSLVRTYLRK